MTTETEPRADDGAGVERKRKFNKTQNYLYTIEPSA